MCIIIIGKHENGTDWTHVQSTNGHYLWLQIHVYLFLQDMKMAQAGPMHQVQMATIPDYKSMPTTHCNYHDTGMD